MKEKLIKLLNLDAKATDDQIVAAVAKLESSHGAALRDIETLQFKILELATEERQPSAIKIDPRIREKMAAGLNFQQATEVVAAQEAEDKAAKKAAK
jgi:hypothetical protein